MNTTRSLKRRIAALLLVAGATLFGAAQSASPVHASANGIFID
jgi:hypothetical protein